MATLRVGQFFSVRHAFKTSTNARVVNLGSAEVSGFMVATPDAPVLVTINKTPHTVIGVSNNAGVITLGEDASLVDVFVGAELVITALPGPLTTGTPVPSPTATPVPPTKTPVPPPPPSATPVPPSVTPTPSPSPSVTPAGPESPDLTVVMSGSSFAIIDSAGNAWTITPKAQVARNGTVDPPTNAVTQIAYVKKQLWQQNTASDWYGVTGTGTPGNAWVGAGKKSPLPTPVPTPTPVPQPSIIVNPIGSQSTT